MGLGFTSTKDEKRAYDTVEGVQELLKNEIRSAADFENTLIMELKELKDIIYNLELIESQMSNIEKLMLIRDETLHKFLKEKMKHDVDIDECRKYYDIIANIDKELHPMMNKAYMELNRYILTDTHKLFSESENARSELQKIDNRAREIIVRLQSFNKTIEQSNAAINESADYLKKIQEERRLRDSKTLKSDDFGFR